MPQAQQRWRHIIINTRGSWLHGDERGFRSRKHRIHSSGDYRNPPPSQEHAGLRAFHQDRSAPEVHIAAQLRPIIGRALLQSLLEQNVRVVAIAVAKVHTHFAAELPDDVGRIKSIVGEAKRKSSRTLKRELPGSVWREGCTYTPIDDRVRLKWVHDYIVHRQGPTAWTWSYRDRSEIGMLTRDR